MIRKTIAMLAAFACGCFHSSAGELSGLRLSRDRASGDLIAEIEGASSLDPARLRLLVNVDGQPSGEAQIGADYMVEGPFLFRHQGPGRAWAWERLGATTAHVVSNHYLIRLPVGAGGLEVRAVAEVTTPDWRIESRFPSNGAVLVRSDELPATDWRARVQAALPAALDLRSASAFLMPGGAIGFRIEGRATPDASHIRIMLDTNGPASGWSDLGADLMSEGALEFRYPEGEKEWKWTPLGGVMSAVESNALFVVLPHARPAGAFKWYVEAFDDRWEVVARLPESGAFDGVGARLPSAPKFLDPPAPDLGELMRFAPTSLSRRIEREFFSRPWREASGDELDSSIRLFVRWTDARTEQTRTLKVDRVQRDGDLFRWTLPVDRETSLDLFIRSAASNEMDVVGAVTSSGDVCFRVTVGVELPERSWVWHDDVRFSAPMEGSRKYANTANTPYGLTHERSLYPFGVVAATDSVFVAATDGDEPRVFLIEASARAPELAIHYDLAATPQTRNFPGRATFHSRFVRTPRTERDPFREALAAWYRDNPEWRASRVKRHGLWMPFTDPATVSNAADFGFAFYEKGGAMGDDVELAHRAGILTLFYTEPWLYWLTLSDATQWNPSAAMERMRDLSRFGFGQERDFASAGLLGGARGTNQQIRMRFMTTPWSVGARMEVSTDPDLPTTPAASINRAGAEWRDIRRALNDPRVNGIYLDSMSAMEELDYNTNAIAVTDYPATFSTPAFQPALGMPIAHMKFVAALRNYLHARGKLVMGNFPCSVFPFFMPSVDIPGEETTWYNGREFTPMDSRELNLRRALSGNRPYGFLQATHFAELTSADVEKYFRECLFWAFMPSFFSFDGANEPYWNNPDWYNRDRSLFLTYLPLIRQMSESGWEPVSDVSVDSSNVWVEQFGTPRGGLFFITARNDGAGEASAKLSGPGIGAFLCYDIFSGAMQRLSPEQPANIFLNPGEMACLWMVRDTPGNLADAASRFSADPRTPTPLAAARINLSSAGAERARGARCSLVQAAPAVAGEAVRLELEIENISSNAIQFLGWRGATGAVESVSIPPGGRRSIAVPKSLGIRATDRTQSVGWTLGSRGLTSLACRRLFRPVAGSALAVVAPEGRVEAEGDAVALVYEAHSKSASMRRAKFVWGGDVAGGTQTLNVAAGEAARVSVRVEKGTNVLRRVNMRIEAEGVAPKEYGTDVVFAPRLKHKATAPGVRVVADSAYAGYVPATLVDGVVEPAGLPWNRAAFATADVAEPHWIRVTFPDAQTVSSVSVYWQSENGVTYTSKRGELYGMTAGGDEVELGAFTSEGKTRATRIEFPPQSLQAIELRQPVSGGSAERPDLLWVTEIAVE